MLGLSFFSVFGASWPPLGALWARFGRVRASILEVFSVHFLVFLDRFWHGFFFDFASLFLRFYIPLHRFLDRFQHLFFCVSDRFFFEFASHFINFGIYFSSILLRFGNPIWNHVGQQANGQADKQASFTNPTSLWAEVV